MGSLLGMQQNEPMTPRWQRACLQIAGGYHLLWAAVCVLFPQAVFEWTGMGELSHPFVWQGIGLFVGLLGLGFLLAATAPHKYWPLALMGFLAKTAAPVGFAMAWLQGEATMAFGALILVNDVLWIPPLAVILYDTLRRTVSGRAVTNSSLSLPAALRYYRMSDGQTIADASEKTPLLMVFLRHLGCTFCQEALKDIAQERAAIESNGAKIVIVHMSDPFQGRAALSRWGLTDLAHVSDPSCELYAVFGLGQGSLGQLFGPKTWWRGFSLLRQGIKVGTLRGDGLRMPGVFLLKQGRILKEFRHRSVADQPDYRSLSQLPFQEEISQSQAQRHDNATARPMSG